MSSTKQATVRPPLGAKVRVKATLGRKTDMREKTKGYPTGQRMYRTWYGKPREPFEAVYVGYRQKYNGWKIWMDDEVGYVAFPEEHREAWMLVRNERENPFFAWPEDCEIITE